MRFSKLTKTALLTVALLASASNGMSQDKLYPNTFALSEVQLLDGPFKHAMANLRGTLDRIEVVNPDGSTTMLKKQ